MNTKGVVELGAVVIVVLVIVFLGWLIEVGQRECNGNRECGENQYCGSDFSCHNIPVIEKETKVNQVNLVKPALTRSSTCFFVNNVPLVSKAIVETCFMSDRSLISSVNG